MERTKENRKRLLLEYAVEARGEVGGVRIDEVHGDVRDQDVCEWSPGGEVGGCLDCVGFAEVGIDLELKIGIPEFFE